MSSESDLSKEPLPPAPDDRWGRSIGGRESWRDVWIRPRDRAEIHATIQLLDACEASVVLRRWAHTDLALLERIHKRAGASSLTAGSDGSGTARFDRLAPGSYTHSTSPMSRAVPLT